MSAGSSSSIGLAGMPTVAPQIQGAAIRAELLGVALRSFSPGSLSAEALARSDPGGANATLTFSKSGQTVALPPELAAKLVGASGGSSLVVVDLAGRAPEGSLAVSIRPAPQAGAPAQPAPQAGARAESASFTSAALALAQTASVPLDEPAQWANAVRELARPQAASLGQPEAQSRAFAQGLSALVPAAGVGFERAVASLAAMGPQAAQEALGALSRFPQMAGPLEASAPQWVAQQAAAKGAGQVMWSGEAWAGAPAWMAVGLPDASSELAREAMDLAAPGQPAVAWLRMRAEPPDLGPIDIWAVWLGSGRASARVRAQPDAVHALEAARGAFSSALAGARVDLSIETQVPL